jgi:hypothetical protein
MAPSHLPPEEDASLPSGEGGGANGPVSQRPVRAWLGQHLRWEKHPLLAWAIQLVVAGAWFAIFLWFATQIEQRFDNYWFFTILSGSLPLSLYMIRAERDQSTRLKPSPFFFWFQGR